MTEQARFRLYIVVLSVACGILAWQALEITSKVPGHARAAIDDLRREKVQAPPPDYTTALRAAAPPPSAGRALFGESRPARSRDQGRAGTEPDAAELVGIVGSPASRLALVRAGETGSVAALSPGTRWHGWVVDAIGSDSVTLVRGSERRRLHLTYKRRPASPPQSARPDDP